LYQSHNKKEHDANNQETIKRLLEYIKKLEEKKQTLIDSNLQSSSKITDPTQFHLKLAKFVSEKQKKDTPVF
jgi:hypothetical protein